MSATNESKAKLYFGNAGVILGAARRAYGRTVRKGVDDVSVLDNCVMSILLSCAAMEAYINETVGLMNEMPDITEDNPKVQPFASILTEAESTHGSIRLKYLLAHSTLKGVTFEKGANPYQDFALLISIRDEIMHYKLEKVTDEPHRIVKKLASKNLCAPSSGTNSTWLSQIATPACARWACNTAAIMINTIQMALFESASENHPASMLRMMAGIQYSELPPIELLSGPEKIVEGQE